MTIRPAIVSLLVFLATKYTSVITFATKNKISSVLLVYFVVKYASVVTFEICVLKEEKEEEEEQQKQQQTR